MCVCVCVCECGAFVGVFLFLKLLKMINVDVRKGVEKVKCGTIKIISWIEYLLQILIPGNKTPI